MLKSLKIGTIGTLAFLIFSFSTSAFAEENVTIEKASIEGKEITENTGVSTNIPSSGISIQSANSPSGTHNLEKSGQMKFEGTAKSSELYTNKYFTGKKNFQIKVTNYHSKTLTVKVYSSGSIKALATYTLDSGSTMYAMPSGTSASKKYYLKFSAPSNFDGYVK